MFLLLFMILWWPSMIAVSLFLMFMLNQHNIFQNLLYTTEKLIRPVWKAVRDIFCGGDWTISLTRLAGTHQCTHAVLLGLLCSIFNSASTDSSNISKLVHFSHAPRPPASCIISFLHLKKLFVSLLLQNYSSRIEKALYFRTFLFHRKLLVCYVSKKTPGRISRPGPDVFSWTEVYAFITRWLFSGRLRSSIILAS